MAKLETLQDSFRGYPLNSALWFTFGSVVPVLNKTELRMTSKNTADYSGLISLGSYDLTNSYLFGHLKFQPVISITSLEIYPVKVDVDATSQNELLWVVLPAAGICKAMKKVAGVGSQVGLTLPYTANILYFRIRHSGSLILWDYSADGTTWINLCSLTNPFTITACYGGVMVGTWQNESLNAIICIDNFNIFAGPRVLVNGADISAQIYWPSLRVDQVLTSEVDSAIFNYKKYGSKSYVPVISDEVIIYDGATKIFGGYIVQINEENLNSAVGLVYSITCSDYSSALDGILAAKSYANQTVAQIIANLISTYAPGFTTTNVVCTFSITKIVFNEIYLGDCIKKLADIVKYDWYVDTNKDLHFFPSLTNPAPFNLTDDGGNYLNNSLKRITDGTQLVNQVKVRGGESDGTTYTDVVTVNGSISKSFVLPYRFSNLTIQLDTGAGYVTKTVGQDFKDDPALFDCLYSYNDSVIKFPADLADGNKIKFTGNPKVPIKSIIKNSGSILLYGLKEKIINDANIVDSTTARKRARAELEAFQNGSDQINFNTYTPGLRDGMIINLSSTRRGVNDNYVITKVSFKTKGPGEFTYSVEAITTNKITLIDLLQRIIAPENPAIDENEIAETIYTDLADINITELITAVSPLLDQATITAVENIQKDPLGAGVEPTWVLGPYTPTSPTDPKRWGHLNGSLKVY